MSNLDKPSRHFCETGELEENEIYNPDIHLYNITARINKCKIHYLDLYKTLSDVKRYHPYSTIHSKRNTKTRARGIKRKKTKNKKQKTKKKTKKKQKTKNNK